MNLCRQLGIEIGPFHAALVMLSDIRNDKPNWTDNCQYNFTDDIMKHYE
jgi:hypothetical protein